MLAAASCRQSSGTNNEGQPGALGNEQATEKHQGTKIEKFNSSCHLEDEQAGGGRRREGGKEEEGKKE